MQRTQILPQRRFNIFKRAGNVRASEAHRMHLTRLEREIVHAILDGCTNREMAQRFGSTEQTVKNCNSSVGERFRQ